MKISTKWENQLTNQRISAAAVCFRFLLGSIWVNCTEDWPAGHLTFTLHLHLICYESTSFSSVNL